MSRGTHGPNRAQIYARLWRSFVTAVYLLGIVAWTAGEARPRAMSMTICLYGRCPAVAVAHARAQPTIAGLALFGCAAVLVAWVVPLVFQEPTDKGDRP